MNTPPYLVNTSLCNVYFELQKEDRLSSHGMSCDEAAEFARALNITKEASLTQFSNITIAYTTSEIQKGFSSGTKQVQSLNHSSETWTPKKFEKLMRCADNKLSCNDWQECILNTKN